MKESGAIVHRLFPPAPVYSSGPFGSSVGMKYVAHQGRIQRRFV